MAGLAGTLLPACDIESAVDFPEDEYESQFLQPTTHAGHEGNQAEAPEFINDVAMNEELAGGNLELEAKPIQDEAVAYRGITLGKVAYDIVKSGISMGLGTAVAQWFGTGPAELSSESIERISEIVQHSIHDEFDRDYRSRVSALASRAHTYTREGGIDGLRSSREDVDEMIEEVIQLMRAFESYDLPQERLQTSEVYQLLAASQVTFLTEYLQCSEAIANLENPGHQIDDSILTGYWRNICNAASGAAEHLISLDRDHFDLIGAQYTRYLHDSKRVDCDSLKRDSDGKCVVRSHCYRGPRVDECPASEICSKTNRDGVHACNGDEETIASQVESAWMDTVQAHHDDVRDAVLGPNYGLNLEQMLLAEHACESAFELEPRPTWPSNQGHWATQWMSLDLDGDGIDEIVQAYDYEDSSNLIVYTPTDDGFRFKTSINIGYLIERWIPQEADGRGVLAAIPAQERYGYPVAFTMSEGRLKANDVPPYLFYEKPTQWVAADMFGNDGVDELYAFTQRIEHGRAHNVRLGYEYRPSSGAYIERVIDFEDDERANLQLLAGDVDGDGVDELVETWDNNGKLGMTVLKGHFLDLGWGNPYQLELQWRSDDVGQGSGALDWQIGDFTGDGKAEIVQLWRNGTQLAMNMYGEHNGGLAFKWGTGDLGQGASAIDFVTGDIDGDGQLELLQPWAADARLAMLSYHWTNGRFVAKGTEQTGLSSLYIGESLVADLDGDGDDEFVAIRDLNDRLGLSVLE